MSHCLQCGIIFKGQSKKSKFCSNRCSALHNNNIKPYLDSRQSLKPPTTVCKGCGVEFALKRHKKQIFCSNLCHGDFMRKQDAIVSFALVEQGKGTSRRCKQYLIETKGNVCTLCGQGTIWNNFPLVLQLDHIDGNSDNNTLSNLRLVCPNCHTQTETYGYKQANKPKKDTKRNTYQRKRSGEKLMVIESEVVEPTDCESVY